MVIDDGKILHLFKLVVKCFEAIDQENPQEMQAYLAELKEELQMTIREITPR
jgi:hypothetical protein